MSMTENAANIAICNLALGLLGTKSITLDGSSTNHTYCTLYNAISIIPNLHLNLEQINYKKDHIHLTFAQKISLLLCFIE